MAVDVDLFKLTHRHTGLVSHCMAFSKILEI